MSVLVDVLVPWASVNVLVCCLGWLSVKGVDRRQDIRIAARESERGAIRQSSDGTLRLLTRQAEVSESRSGQ
jgi:hypothetical protein